MTNSRMRVLYSVPAPSTASNPYTTMLARHIASDADVSFLSWGRALSSHQDVFHVHWPEAMVRHPRPVRHLARVLAGFTYLLKARVTRTKIVQTVHNRNPHEAGGVLERLFLRVLDRQIAVRIYLTDDGSALVPPSLVIPHGDYREWEPYHVPHPTLKSGVLFFGAIRRYKGLEAAIAAFRADPTFDQRLDIAGGVSDSKYQQEIFQLIGGDARIRFQPGRLSDADLAHRVRGASVVVLPYKDFYNSGAVLLALSLGTHVLLPRNPVTMQLQAEFGDEWVSLFDEPLSASDIRIAVQRSASASGEPNMAARSWNRIQEEHMNLYRRLRPNRESFRKRRSG